MSESPVRLLLVEDNPRDAELVLRALKRDGIEAAPTIVGSRQELSARLDDPFELIITDYRLPDIDLAHAIEQLRRHQPDVPLLVVSGSTAEEQLLAAVRLGADDYLQKDRLARLGEAVRNAQERHKLRRDRLVAEAEVRQREEELRHLQRIESIGLLTGSIAHDFNNLLTVVLGNIDEARHTLPGAHPAEELLGDAQAATTRAATLTRRLLSFARSQSEGLRDLDLTQVVQGFLVIGQTLLGKRVDVSLSSEPDLPQVRADRLQLEQVLMNLLMNARDAMPNGGRVTIRISHASTEQGGPAVQLSIRDEGTGMTADVKRHLFVPFFTTKPQGIGTGLGLSTTLAIVRQLGGSVEVDSEPGQGTEFRIVLPASAPGTEEGEAMPNASGRTILVVEPEPLLRATIAAALGRAGYAVVTAASPDDHPALARAAQQPLELVVSDAAYGTRITAQLQDLSPDGTAPPVLNLAEHAPGQSHASGASTLTKPFTLSELMAEVGRLIGQPRNT